MSDPQLMVSLTEGDDEGAEYVYRTAGVEEMAQSEHYHTATSEIYLEEEEEGSE